MGDLENGAASRRRRPKVALLVALLALLGVLAGASPASAAPAKPSTLSYPTVEVSANLRYATATSANGSPVALTLDVYRSRELNGIVRPAVVWVHGGGFYSGDKADPTDVQVATLLAARGFVVISVNYRLRPDLTPFGPTMTPAAGDATQDVQQALRWLRRHYRDFDIDPFHIGVAGVSAGAITAVQVGYPSRLDLLASVQSVVSLSGASLLPLRPNPWSPPTLMINGTEDVLIPISAARTTCSQLNAGRRRCTPIEVPTNHDLAGQEALVLNTSVDHLTSTLQLDRGIAFGRWLRQWQQRWRR